MTVIIGTDFSLASQPIADVAAELARRRGEDLVVAHVMDGPLLPSTTFPQRELGTVQEEARRLRAFGCRVRPELLHDGNVGKRLAQLAETENASVLVVGAQGHGLRSPLGTVATSALRHVTRPVLVVRRAELLWSASASQQSRPRALVPFALDATDAGLVEALQLVASAGDVDVDFAHFTPLAAPAPSPTQRALIDNASSLGEAALRDHFGGLPVGVGVRSIIGRDAFGRLDAHVVQLARESNADLIICGSHHRHGVERMMEGSVAEGIALHAPVSVLVARAPASHNQRLASAFA
jgi:nucleotide-binding universal stress UspA family protein